MWFEESWEEVVCIITIKIIEDAFSTAYKYRLKEYMLRYEDIDYYKFVLDDNGELVISAKEGNANSSVFGYYKEEYFPLNYFCNSKFYNSDKIRECYPLQYRELGEYWGKNLKDVVDNHESLKDVFKQIYDNIRDTDCNFDALEKRAIKNIIKYKQEKLDFKEKFKREKEEEDRKKLEEDDGEWLRDL
ncbi:hypothetical protein [Clostridium perfringens]|uniref:hypothetical protein n=1 Tax=Clostridium perfringens TaxID=1502 RepID=UPI0024BC1EEB|nr:hypothetical protein [Clostridium perfringens]